MLTIEIPASNGELFDEKTNEFLYLPAVTMYLEHSLISISKWEMLTHKAFIDPTTEHRSIEDTLLYIQCMTLNPSDVPPDSYKRLTQEHISKIENYMEDPMTATVINHGPNKPQGPRKKMTNEEIYQLMIVNGIPVEFEKWNINRLMTLIDVCQIKGQPPKKMGKNEALEYQRQLNQARRAKHK